MRKVILIFITCTLFLVGCQNVAVKNNGSSESENTSKNIVINYEGTSKNWTATYKMDGNENLHDSYYTFKYTGEEGSSIKDVKYMIDGPKEGESGKFILNSENEYTDKMRQTGGIPSSSDRGINVKLEWNGETELLLLKRDK